ncbi:MAG TPA: hypothetical protein VNI57_10520 [Candidatus Saccharimonadales bacterium]|nr:hypothetical protein [Candidatus Saccharimonadales bacterium]
MRASRPLLAGAVVLALLTPLAGQVAGRGDPNEKEQWIAPDLPPSAYAFGEKPAPVEKVYKVRTKKVWKKLHEMLEAEQVPILSEDSNTGLVQTDFKIFDEMKGPFRDVATPPRTASRTWPIRQWVHLDRGRYKLEILVTPDDKTRVSIRSYIEERAFHIGADQRIWAERYSNGTIEKYFFDKLDKILE